MKAANSYRWDNWLFVPAVFVFCGFWFFALTERLPTLSRSAPQQQTEIKSGAAEVANRADIAAETVAEYTKVLAWFTGALAIASIIQGAFLWRSDRLARDAANLAKKTADDNLHIALSQIDEARQSRILQYRPKLHVRNVVVKSPSKEIPAFTRGYPIIGQFYVSNVGGVRAHITESHCEVFWTRDLLPMERPYEGKNGNNPIGKVTIAPGTSSVGQFSTEGTFNEKNPGYQGGTNFYVMGWIEYSDDSAIRRRTAFCRQFVDRHGGGRFEVVANDDYEHEE